MHFETYRKHSPMTHVENVHDADLDPARRGATTRVPISQGYEYYHALKHRGVTAKMVVYPRTPHGPREPKFVMDIMQRHLDWVDKYVRYKSWCLIALGSCGVCAQPGRRICR